MEGSEPGKSVFGSSLPYSGTSRRLERGDPIGLERGIRTPDLRSDRDDYERRTRSCPLNGRDVESKVYFPTSETPNRW